MSTCSLENFKIKLFTRWGNKIHIVDDTYLNAKKKAQFIDIEFPNIEWWSTPNNVLNGRRHPKGRMNRIKITCQQKYGSKSPLESTIIKTKIKKTMIDKYGCEFPCQNSNIKYKMQQTMMKKHKCTFSAQNKDIALQQARTANKIIDLIHWKTGDTIPCQGSYEVKTVQYLNANKIDFNWQIVFNMPNGKTYRVDAYLPETDKYIEIKGYFRKDALEKWKWFHQTYPNSELWDKNKLTKLAII